MMAKMRHLLLNVHLYWSSPPGYNKRPFLKLFDYKLNIVRNFYYLMYIYYFEQNVHLVKLGITCMQTYSGLSTMPTDTHFGHLSLDVLSSKCSNCTLSSCWIFKVYKSITYNKKLNLDKYKL